MQTRVKLYRSSKILPRPLKSQIRTQNSKIFGDPTAKSFFQDQSHFGTVQKGRLVWGEGGGLEFWTDKNPTNFWTREGGRKSRFSLRSFLDGAFSMNVPSNKKHFSIQNRHRISRYTRFTSHPLNSHPDKPHKFYHIVLGKKPKINENCTE